jgi:hypothetical protein
MLSQGVRLVEVASRFFARAAEMVVVIHRAFVGRPEQAVHLSGHSRIVALLAVSETATAIARNYH